MSGAPLASRRFLGESADFVVYGLGAPEDGFRVFVHTTDRFKTTTIRLYFHTALTARTVAATALLPALWRRGCRRYPSMQALSRRLDDLYGAHLDADVLKIGEEQLIMAGIDLVSDRFLPARRGILGEGIDLLFDMVFDTMGDDSGFPADLVEQEAAHLAVAVDSLCEDRLHYGIERCFQSMCASEPFAVYEYGNAAMIREVTPQTLRARYEEIRQSAPLDVFVVGAVDAQRVVELLDERMMPAAKRHVIAPPRAVIVPAPARPRRLFEIVSGDKEEHGELVLGYRSGVAMDHPLSPALIILDEMLGGGPSSRLFRILREEMRLMYSISSFLVKSKGLWMVVASVASEARKTVEETVATELARVARSEIEEEEFEAARQQVLSQVRTIDDGPGKKISFMLGRLINGRVATPLQAEAEFNQVTLAELAAAAATIRLDTSYYLSARDDA